MISNESPIQATSQRPVKDDVIVDGPGARSYDLSTVIRKPSPDNAMSIDVEEYFQVSAFESRFSRDQWPSIPGRVENSIHKILELLDKADAKATFFSLGWVAERYPAMIRAIADSGHELASHGYDHKRVWQLTPEEFLDDIRSSKSIIEDAAGQEVIGYRAPSFSFTEDTEWAYEKLLEAGYRYSSSIYPIAHDHYGMPNAPRFPFRNSPSGVVEIPLTTTRFASRNVPAAGGGYFRLLPLAVSTWAVRRVNAEDMMPATFYFHPWEIDPDQPRVDGLSVMSRFRHYVNLGLFEKRFVRLLSSFRWCRMDHVYAKAIVTA